MDTTEELKQEVQAAEAERPKKKTTITDAEIDKAAMEFGETLKGYPKVKCLIPINPISKKETDATVCLNGYIFHIKKGVKVELPEPIYDILEEAGFFNGKR